MGAFDDLIPQQASPAPSAGAFDDLIPAAKQAPIRPPVQANAELNVAEKLVSMLPKGAQDWLSNPSVAGVKIGKGSAVNGVMMGAADPVVGAVQLAANLPGVRDVLTQKPSLSSLVTGETGKNSVNQAIDAKNAEYELARAGQGRDGFDGARLLGNVVSPTNVVLSAVAPINAASKLGLVAQGARAGALGGAMAPVIDADKGIWGEKAVQTGIGAATGGALSPAVSEVGKKLARSMVAKQPEHIAAQVDDAMLTGLNKLRTEGVELGKAQINALRQQVADAMQNGEKLDVAAMVRKGDFESLGMTPTKGQITRDPSQFSKEKNLRGVSGVGDPLLARFNTQEQKLQELVKAYSAGASDGFSSGESLMKSLQGVDDQMKSAINGAYDQARDHLGRAAPMDHVAFSTAANHALDSEMLGGVLPAQVRGILNDVTLGKIPFNVNTAVQIDQTLSRIQRGASDAEKYAIGKVRDELNSSPIADNVGEDAKRLFDSARGMARERFAKHEAIPALKAAADGNVSAQDFVNRFLINGKAEDVRGLAQVMDASAFETAKKQFGAALERAAYGGNMAGDAAFSQERFARFLNQPGMPQKIEAFFGTDGLDQLKRIARVAAYKNSLPANNVVNTSNTGTALANLGWVSKIPGVPASLGLLGAAKNAAGNQMAVGSALRAEVPKTAAGIAPEQAKFLARILGGGLGGVATAAGTGIGN